MIKTLTKAALATSLLIAVGGVANALEYVFRYAWHCFGVRFFIYLTCAITLKYLVPTSRSRSCICHDNA